MGLRRSATLAAAAALTVTCSLLGCAAAGHAHASGTPGIRQQLAAAVAAQRRQLGIPGVTVMAQDPRLGLWAGSFGTANRTTGEPMRAADHFRIASVTKTFVATVVLQLVQEGKLRFSDRLYKWVPVIPNSGQITIRELLNHTSGIRDYEDNPVLAYSIANQPLRVWTTPELVQLSLFLPPVFQPGAGWKYSNTNYLLLGIIVEKVTGHSLGYEIRRRVLAPLAMRQTSFPLADPSLPPPLSHGYAPAGIVGPPDNPVTDYTRWSPSWDFGAGNMVSTAPDLLAWGPALAKGTLLGPAMRAAQRSWVRAGKGQDGLGLFRSQLAGVYFLGHGGEDPGYASDVFYAPALGLTLVVLANRCCNRPYANLIFKHVAAMIVHWEQGQGAG